MECQACVSMPRVSPLTEKVLPLSNLLQGSGDDASFAVLPNGAEFLAICGGEDNDAFSKYVTGRLYHEMEICKSDIIVHFHALAKYLRHITVTAIFPNTGSAEHDSRAFGFNGDLPPYKDVVELVRSVNRLPKVAARLRTVIESDLTAEESSERIREAIAYWNCPCANVQEQDGQIVITHCPMDVPRTSLKEGGYTVMNIRALDQELDHGLNRLSKELTEITKSVKDVEVKHRDEVGPHHGEDTHCLSLAIFCYDVLAQTIECSTKAVNDIFSDFHDHVTDTP